MIMGSSEMFFFVKSLDERSMFVRSVDFEM